MSHKTLAATPDTYPALIAEAAGEVDLLQLADQRMRQCDQRQNLIRSIAAVEIVERVLTVQILGLARWVTTGR